MPKESGPTNPSGPQKVRALEQQLFRLTGNDVSEEEQTATFFALETIAQDLEMGQEERIELCFQACVRIMLGVDPSKLKPEEAKTIRNRIEHLAQAFRKSDG